VIAAGMILSLTAMIIFTRLTPGGSYAAQVLAPPPPRHGIRRRIAASGTRPAEDHQGGASR
jgi:hypothetical protein